MSVKTFPPLEISALNIYDTCASVTRLNHALNGRSSEFLSSYFPGKKIVFPAAKGQAREDEFSPGIKSCFCEPLCSSLHGGEPCADCSISAAGYIAHKHQLSPLSSSPNSRKWLFFLEYSLSPHSEYVEKSSLAEKEEAKGKSLTPFTVLNFSAAVVGERDKKRVGFSDLLPRAKKVGEKMLNVLK